ncbi:MAG: aminotransferase class III-fold pyridoxal phosphate-dependent enzyme, partial [Muribaculaceae bacterium]|nr:aminotransferase class III-fold pyridoxal phosphate-dependent enzyme [Muribaculaceae bacterium]
IMCIGKGLTAGYLTMSAVLTTREVADTISRGEAGVLMHGPTFMGNPLACAIAVESIKMLAEQDMAARIARIEAAMRKRLERARGLDNVADVRVLGSIGVVETTTPVDVGRFQRRCVDRGVWIRPFGNNVYIMPPYIISDEELATLCEALVDLVAEFQPGQ